MNQGLAEDRTGSESGASKALFAAVIIMGVMIVVGVAVMIGVIGYRAMHPHHGPALETQASKGPARLTLPLGEGEHILSVTARGDGMMAVTLGRPGAERVLLWNPEAGNVAAELDFGSVAGVP
ncbi:hypothetical protein [Gluconobacter japonicus]|uniref:hypothetical protein n=1 Tax=Gluconobacter japonicus TaxID=376620 RepID=UPI000ACFC2B2|nr:hypothetical protein [Gluconobacter japonicus]